MKPLMTAAGGGLLALALMAAGPADRSAVYGWIDGQPFTQAEIDAELAKIPEAAIQMQLGMDTATREKIVEGLMARRFFLLDAARQKLDQSDTFIRIMEQLRKDALLRYYAEKLTAEVTVPTETEALTYFRQNPDKFMTPGGVECEYIIVRGESVARDILKKIKKPADFAKLRAAHSLSRETGAVLNDMLLAREPQMKLLLDGLKPGQVATTPFTRDGQVYFIFRKVRVVKAEAIPFERLKEDIMRALYDERVNALVTAHFEELKARYFKPATP